MLNLCIIAEDRRAIEELCQGLTEDGYSCSIVADAGEVARCALEKAPALVLLEGSGYSRIEELSRKIKREKDIPIIALLHAEMIGSVAGPTESIDDFVIKPWNLKELELRIRRRLRRTDFSNDETIRCGDLAIDVSRYEVFVSGRPIVLTFKEYELLKFLASNQGRVFTREALLNKVWGYDYYGGDRTVDAHIRRLRGKIEDSTHSFIDTVRNIGYRFRDDI